jgi:hypothetical protein
LWDKQDKKHYTLNWAFVQTPVPLVSVPPIGQMTHRGKVKAETTEGNNWKKWIALTTLKHRATVGQR